MFPVEPGHVDPPKDTADSDGSGTPAWAPPG